MPYENTIHESEVMAALDRAGLRYKESGRYIVAQCPKHQEQNPSCQIFKDDWFCNCLAGCGRFPITDPFPELRDHNYSQDQLVRRPKIEAPREYKPFDLTGDWTRLPLIPRAHTFKSIPLEVLDDLGWRWDASKNSYFIPYFNQDRSKIPFAQWRHLTGERRFTFLAGARPTLYGKWNIGVGERLFIVEGASDAAALQNALVPWVALPSASSGSILKAFAQHATTLGCTLVYAGDNDLAGDSLRAALDASGAPYRVCQPPERYKDWGDFQVAEGPLAILAHCQDKLFE